MDCSRHAHYFPSHVHAVGLSFRAAWFACQPIGPHCSNLSKVVRPFRPAANREFPFAHASPTTAKNTNPGRRTEEPHSGQRVGQANSDGPRQRFVSEELFYL